MKRNIIIPAIAIAALLTATSLRAQSEYDTALANCPKQTLLDVNTSGCLVGVQAPDFTAKTVDGKSIRLSDLKGKVVVLNFWFIACAPCHAEAPALKKIAAQFDKDVTFISIARETEDDLKKYVVDNAFFDTNIADKSSDISKGIYHVFGFPTTIVVDKQGKIKYYTLGGSTSEAGSEKELNAKLVPAISEALKASK
ncbi:MAG: TlpA family protein disulfide reductase [Bacteroidetes bacterium]|nr:TlpA family protein disulfide reductase [Bacteroidota bacterium]